MHANLIMVKNVMTCRPDQTVAEAIEFLNTKTFRIIPVVDDENHILGAVNTLTLLSHIVPEYIVDGYLQSVPFAPDIGLLRKHYQEILKKNITDVMDDNPTIVREDESLLSATAAMVTHDRFEYVLVVDGEQHLAGIISSSDILRAMDRFIPEKAFDA